MAVACGVRTSVTKDLNSSIMASVTSPPFSLARDFCREPRWSMAAAAMTPRSFETAFRPASLPGVSFMRILLDGDGNECVRNELLYQGSGGKRLPQTARGQGGLIARSPSFVSS